MSNLVTCIRKGKALVVSQSQFMDYFTDNFSADLITKEEYQIAKAKELKDANSNLHPIFQNIFNSII